MSGLSPFQPYIPARAYRSKFVHYEALPSYSKTNYWSYFTGDKEGYSSSNRLEELVDAGVLDHYPKEALFIYRQEGAHTFTGILGLASTSEYNRGRIKKHEQVHEDRVENLAAYLDHYSLNPDPIVVAHADDAELTQLIQAKVEEQPYLKLTTDDYVTHSIWAIEDKQTIRDYQDRIREKEKLYIADGHHRSASCSYLKRPYIFSYFINESQLRVQSFYRGFSIHNPDKLNYMLWQLKKFELERVEELPLPPAPGLFGVITNDGYYQGKLPPKEALSATERLCVFQLDEHVIAPVLAEAGYTKARPVYVDGHIRLSEIQLQIQENRYSILFTIAPATVGDVKATADADEFMPPKSTRIEPKALGGLLLHKLEKDSV